MTSFTNIIRTTTRAATLFAMSFIACAVVFGTIETVSPNHAFAASKSKKAQEATKRMGKSFDYLVKAGKKAQKKRGIGKHIGKAMTNVGKGGSKYSKGLGKGIKKASKGVNKFVSKSKTGRAIQKGMKKVQQRQNQAIDKAFKICNGKVCGAAKKTTKFLAPM